MTPDLSEWEGRFGVWWCLFHDHPQDTDCGNECRFEFREVTDDS
jgi:hypothetical protein